MWQTVSMHVIKSLCDISYVWVLYKENGDSIRAQGQHYSFTGTIHHASHDELRALIGPVTQHRV